MWQAVQSSYIEKLCIMEKKVKVVMVCKHCFYSYKTSSISQGDHMSKANYKVQVPILALQAHHTCVSVAIHNYATASYLPHTSSA